MELINRLKQIVAVDLFCGAGGLTHGFLLEGINICAGIDIDPACRYPFEYNNQRPFLQKDLKAPDSLLLDTIRSFLGKNEVRILIGCAPCQPFSKYTQNKKNQTDEKWKLLSAFSWIIEKIRPEIVVMENVPQLRNYQVFVDFVETLTKLGYLVTYEPNVNCARYGIPQIRKRLVLFGSLYGKVNLVDYTHHSPFFKTVRDTISHLPMIEAGQKFTSDPLHCARQLSPKNLERIRHSKPGGTWRDWETELRTECHKKETGQSYPSVYGRMSWDFPSPTITTQFYGFGNGRFGHPEQDRALSLREAALLQTFPTEYSFSPPDKKISIKETGRLIGNAVPVGLGKIIAQSLISHIKSQNK